MTAFSRFRRIGAPIASAAATAALLTGVLWVQHAREGWPFAPGSQAATTSAPPAAASAIGTADTHNRVPVDVSAATVQALDIRVETVRRESLTQSVRAVAT